MNTSGLGGQYGHMQGLALDKTIDVFSPPGASVASSSRDSLSVCSLFISLCPATEVCNVFGNRVLLSIYGGQPTLTVITCTGLSAPGTLDQQLAGSNCGKGKDVS